MEEPSEGSQQFQQVPNDMLYPPSADDKEDFQMTRTEFDQLKDALKNETFRTMLAEYAEEIQDPKSRTTYQEEMKELAKQHGNIMHFVNPVAGFVLKTSVNGEKKAFINVCSNPMIRKLSFQKAVQQNQRGAVCSIPYAQSPGREDMDKAGRYCVVYDVIFHPNTLALCQADQRIQQQVESIALEAVETSFKVKLDKNNVRKPNIKYKGLKHATVIKYKIGEQPPSVLDPDQIGQETPPQPQEPYYKQRKSELNTPAPASRQNKSLNKKKPDEGYKHKEKDWTTPKYELKYRSHVDLQDFCLDNQREGRTGKPIPEEIILTVDLPLIPDSSGLDADVMEGGWDFELTATGKASYRLQLKLPFQVHCEQSKATFDVDKRKLTIVMKTVQKQIPPLVHGENNNLHAKAFDISNSSIMVETQNDKVGDSANDEEAITNNRPLKHHEDSARCENTEGSVTQPEELPQCVPEFINGDVVVKSILKRSARSRSLSESWLDDRVPSLEDEFMSLENLNEADEEEHESHTHEKSVRFKEGVQQQLFRSNSSILGQRKKNQRKSKNKRKARGRLSSEGSISSMDEEEILTITKSGFDANFNEYSGSHPNCDKLKDSDGKE